MRGQGKLREELAPPCGTAALSPLRSDRALTGLVRAGHDQHGGLALARRWPNPPTGLCASRGCGDRAVAARWRSLSPIALLAVHLPAWGGSGLEGAEGGTIGRAGGR